MSRRIRVEQQTEKERKRGEKVNLASPVYSRNFPFATFTNINPKYTSWRIHLYGADNFK